MKALRLLVYRLLALSAVRAPVRLVARLARQNMNPAVVEVAKADTVLVLAPHMDDETIGCGGAILAHTGRGERVEVAFLTDGVRGFEPEVQSQHSPQQLCDIRKREADSACELLGIARQHYLGLPDGRSAVSAVTLEQMRSLLASVQPDIVYLPFITDAHHDHVTCNNLFIQATRGHSKFDAILCCAYEVWTPLHPNCIVDISKYMDVKMAALACYESQLEMNNYIRSVQGLNAYRAIANRSQGFAEAFYLTTVKDYQTLLEHL